MDWVGITLWHSLFWWSVTKSNVSKRSVLCLFRNSMADRAAKVPWKRAELAVNRFTKTAETDVSRLHQFKKNVLEVIITLSLWVSPSIKHQAQRIMKFGGVKCSILRCRQVVLLGVVQHLFHMAFLENLSYFYPTLLSDRWLFATTQVHDWVC